MRRLLFAALLVAAEVEAAPLVKERIPIPLYVIGPDVPTTSAELIRGRADAMIRVRTRMSVTSLEALGIQRSELDACGVSTNLGCWVAAVRSHRTATAPPYMIVATVHSGERGRLAILLIDLDRAVRAKDHVPADRPGWREQLEALMYQDAVHSHFAELDPSDPGALDTFFAALFDGPVRELFESAGHWRENGTIEIEAPRAGLTIGVDGEPAGVTTNGRTVVEGVPVGERKVELIDPTGLLEHRPIAVRIERGRTARLVPSLSSGPSAIPAVRSITLWTGVAAAAAGVGLLIYAFAAPRDGHQLLVCPGGECPAVDGRYATFSGDPSGVPIAPIAAGLFGTGVGWSLGALLFGEEHELPWIAWLCGVGLGGAALAGTWAAD